MLSKANQNNVPTLEQPSEHTGSKDDSSKQTKATFLKKRSMDFVPALRVDGKLGCIAEFATRVQNKSWPDSKIVDEICNTEVFIVARTEPDSQDTDKDFRLSFNLAEIMLVRSFPGAAKIVFIIMKSYLKGIIRESFIQESKKSKLKSYTLKQ